ncbi:MAG: phosphoribosylamine--glycine ligase, partial [Lysobacterales bacterium]
MEAAAPSVPTSPPLASQVDHLVVVAASLAEAEAAVDAMLTERRFGAAGGEVVIEEFLAGEEASFFALTDGVSALPLASAQDHKRAHDGDTGPNTGGMGAYSPAPAIDDALARQVMARIIEPTIAAMAAEGRPFKGVLYAGLMLTVQGPKLLEYNARFGDPECQVLMMRYQGDLAELLLACAENRLATLPSPRFSPDTALTVVMAAHGYPGTPRPGGSISGLAAAEAAGAKVVHAGTRREGEQLVASGGRVLNVTACGATVAEAQARAYAAVDAIDFPDGFCRRDIGWREVAREAESSLAVM